MSSASPRRLLHLLTGCTAVGKTEWALRWAEANSAEIISCDSLLIYRGMDIGTAKPSAAELKRVRHHLIDIRDVQHPMNAALYATLAKAAAEDIAARGGAVLVVGGSGFYLKSFFSAVADGLTVSPAIRAQVDSMMAHGGLPLVREKLDAMNPAGLGKLDTANPRRMAAALSRCLASGRTLAELAANFRRVPGPFADWEVRLARLERPAPELDERIAARVAAMLSAGLVEEVARLAGCGLLSNPSACRAIGYRETLAVLAGSAPLEGLSAAIAQDTRALVKKQRTWFRTQLPPHRVVEPARLADPSGLFLR